MSMFSRFIQILAMGALLSSPVMADDTETPQFTNLQAGEPAPFAGTLFNPPATAQLIAENQFSMSSCDLRIEFEIGRTQADCQLRVDLLQASYDSLNERHQLLMGIKQQEIETYREMAIAQPNRHNHWWMAGGVVAGIGLTLGVLFASQEIQQ